MPESWHLLGLMAYQTGQRDVAVEYVRRWQYDPIMPRRRRIWGIS